MITDNELLQYYMWGFKDELGGKSSVKHDESIKYDVLKQKAYNLGKLDAIVGDDVKSVDLQTNEEILNKIREDEN